MKRTPEELRRYQYFNLMNLLQERYHLGKDIDLDQLKQLTQNGKIDVAVNINTDTEPFKVLKESTLKGQRVCIIVMQTDLRDYKLYARFKEMFEPVDSFEDEKNEFFKEFIEKEIVPDEKIYHKVLRGSKNLRYPKVFGYGEFIEPIEPYFMEYAFPIQYSNRPKVTAFIKRYYSRTSPKNLQNIPNEIREKTIIVVGKKN